VQKAQSCDGELNVAIPGNRGVRTKLQPNQQFLLVDIRNGKTVETIGEGYLKRPNWAKIDHVQVKEALRSKIGLRRTIRKVPEGLALRLLWTDQEMTLKSGGP
jgi:hypothetical protein